MGRQPDLDVPVHGFGGLRVHILQWDDPADAGVPSTARHLEMTSHPAAPTPDTRLQRGRGVSNRRPSKRSHAAG
jgi:hypothetical protein